MTFSDLSPALRFVVAAAVAWLITLYLVHDNGPPLPGIGPLFLRLRLWAGFRAVGVDLLVDDEPQRVPIEDLPPGIYDESEIVYEHDGQFLARMLDCHRCAGFWIGMVVGLAAFGLSWAGLFMAAGVTGLNIMVHELMSDVKRLN